MRFPQKRNRGFLTPDSWDTEAGIFRVDAMGLHHIAIICSSEESLDFYKRLGFKEIFRKTRSYDLVVLMEGQDTRLEIFIDPNHPRRATDPETLGVRHIAIKVDDLDKARQ